MTPETRKLIEAVATSRLKQAEEAEQKAAELEKEAAQLRKQAASARAISQELARLRAPEAPKGERSNP